jgi:hypothetical protein
MAGAPEPQTLHDRQANMAHATKMSRQRLPRADDLCVLCELPLAYTDAAGAMGNTPSTFRHPGCHKLTQGERYMVHWNGAAWFVKAYGYFVVSGGFKQPWGAAWREMWADSIEHARDRAKLQYGVRGERWPLRC